MIEIPLPDQGSDADSRAEVRTVRSQASKARAFSVTLAKPWPVHVSVGLYWRGGEKRKQRRERREVTYRSVARDARVLDLGREVVAVAIQRLDLLPLLQGPDDLQARTIVQTRATYLVHTLRRCKKSRRKYTLSNTRAEEDACQALTWETYEIPPEELVLGAPIGAGSYGAVVRGTCPRETEDGEAERLRGKRHARDATPWAGTGPRRWP